jgi:CelD/BcsL family acetyltransferase involved in cellulose biosynthesis
VLNRPQSSLPPSRGLSVESAQPQAASPAAPAVSVELASSDDEFAALAPAWNRLHDEAEAASVFNSWAWLYEWWRTYGAGRHLRLLVARQGGTIVGVLPLYLGQARTLGLPVRLLRPVGIGADTHPDDLSPVLARGCASEAALALARAALGLAGADAWLFSEIDPRSAFPAALEAAARELGRPLVPGASTRIAYLDLPDTWDRFLGTLGRDRRWQLRRSRRRLAEEHGARFFVWDDPTTLDGAIERLATLHRMRWDMAGARHSFATAAYIDFHRSIVKSFFRRRWLRLYCLEVDGEIGAMIYCYRFRRKVFLMQAGFDPRHRRLGIGKALLGYALEHAIAEGNEAFDFLRGEHRYKQELATGYRQTLCAYAFRSTPAAFVYRLRRAWLPAVKARLQGWPGGRLAA